MFIPRVRVAAEPKAALDLQAGVAREVLYVPQRVGLAFKERHDDGAAVVERGEDALEKRDEEFLVVAYLAVDVGGFAAYMGEVEEDAGKASAEQGRGKRFCCVGVVEEFVVGGAELLLCFF